MIRTDRSPESRARLVAANRAAARAAGLRYVCDADPGIQRVKMGNGFVYVSPTGRRINDVETLARIKSIVIPPAWTDVWICPHERGHIQAVGRDARGRKQYRYHARWREARDRSKYDKLVDFAQALPRIRRAVKRDLARPGLPREKVLAAVIAITERTFIRVGNDEYANHNGSYGLTTLRDGHAKISGQKVHFEFKGKSGIDHEIDLEDPKLAQIVRRCRDLPGQELFQYLDEAAHVRDVTSADVNAYLRSISGADFTAKDFRTWAGTVLAVRALCELAEFQTKSQMKKNIVQAIDRVARRLGNTRAVCRKCYIHPAVIEAYTDGTLGGAASRQTRTRPHPPGARLRAEESAVLALLQRATARPRTRAAA